jgi:hypothetical protein
LVELVHTPKSGNWYRNLRHTTMTEYTSDIDQYVYRVAARAACQTWRYTLCQRATIKVIRDLDRDTR